MVHMRLLDEVVPELKKLDPDTKVTRNAIRRWGLSGKIPTVMVGKKRLYNVDAIIDFLSNPQPEQPEQSSGIRRVPENIRRV